MHNQRNARRLLTTLSLLALLGLPLNANASVCNPGGLGEGAIGLGFLLATIPTFFAPQSEFSAGGGLASADTNYPDSTIALSARSEGRWGGFTYQPNFRARTHLASCNGGSLADGDLRFMTTIGVYSGFELRGWFGLQVGIRMPDMITVGPGVGAGVRKPLGSLFRWDAFAEMGAGLASGDQDDEGLLALSATLVNRLSLIYGVGGLFVEADLGVEPFMDTSQAADDQAIRSVEPYVPGAVGVLFVY